MGNCGSSNAAARASEQNYAHAQRVVKGLLPIHMAGLRIVRMSAIGKIAGVAAIRFARLLHEQYIVLLGASKNAQFARTAVPTLLSERGLTENSARLDASTQASARLEVSGMLATATKSSKFHQLPRARGSRGFGTIGCLSIASSCNRNSVASSSVMSKCITSMAAKTITVLKTLSFGNVRTQPGFARLIIIVQAAAASNLGSLAAKAVS